MRYSKELLSMFLWGILRTMGGEKNIRMDKNYQGSASLDFINPKIYFWRSVFGQSVSIKNS